MSSSTLSNQSTVRACVALHGAVFLFGVAGLFGKLLQISPFFVVFARAGIAAFIIAALRSMKRERTTVTAKEAAALGITGIILTIHWATFFYSIQISSVAIGLLSYSSFPIFTAFLEPLYFKQRFAARNIVVALLVFCGLVIIVPHFSLQNSATQGLVWGTVSGFTFALLSIANRAHVRHLSPQLTAMWQNSIAAVFLLPYAIAFPWASLTGVDYALLILLGVVFTAFAHSLFIFALGTLTAQFASVIAALEPVYGILFAYLFLEEIPSIRTCIGGLLIIMTTVIESFLVAQRTSE